MGVICYPRSVPTALGPVGPSRIQFQWRAGAGQGNAPPEPYRVLCALRSFAEEHGLRLQEHKQLIGHFHAPWITIWKRGAGGAMVIAVRQWVARTWGGPSSGRIRGSAKEVIVDVSVDCRLDGSCRCALWNTWRAFPALAPVWERGANWHSSATRRLRESFIPEQGQSEAVRPSMHTLYYWDR